MTTQAAIGSIFHRVKVGVIGLLKSTEILAVAAAMVGLALPQTTLAQTARTLADGRTATPDLTVSGCQPATVIADRADGVNLEFRCTVDSGGGRADAAGTGNLMIVAQAGRLSPAQFLTSQATEWFPDFQTWPQAQKDNFITRSTKRLASGPATFACLVRDNIDALDGDAICALDTPGTQLVVIAKSTMALTADNVVDAILAGVSLR